MFTINLIEFFLILRMSFDFKKNLESHGVTGKNDIQFILSYFMESAITLNATVRRCQTLWLLRWCSKLCKTVQFSLLKVCYICQMNGYIAREPSRYPAQGCYSKDQERVILP